MIPISILLLFFCLYCFFIVGKSKNNYFHPLVLPFFKIMALYIVFPLIWFIVNEDYYWNGLTIDIFNYYPNFIFIFLFFTSLTSGYLLSTNKYFSCNLSNSSLSFVLYPSLILLFILFYLLINNIEGSLNLLNPRKLYEESRIGLGIYYFSLKFLYKIIFIIALIQKKYLFVMISSLFFFLSGSKTELMNLFLISFYFYIYFNDKKISFFSTIKLSIILLSILLVAFYILAPYQISNFHNLMIRFVDYSNYTRNFSLLYDNLQKFFYGIIGFENNFYSLIPRLIFEDKPMIFGSFRITEMMHPELLEKGASTSYGFYSPFYADFGIFGYVIFFIKYFIFGYIISFLENTLRKTKSFYIFLLFLTFIGIPLFSVGTPSIMNEVINVVIVFLLLILVNTLKIKRTHL